MNNIARYEQKVTLKGIREIDMLPISNILSFQPGYPVASKYWRKELNNHHFKLIEKDTIDGWGKPNIQVNEYESAPGLWIFTDNKTNVVWYIWSDLHHKNAWKGTSYEAIVPGTLTDTEMKDSLERFIKFLGK